MINVNRYYSKLLIAIACLFVVSSSAQNGKSVSENKVSDIRTLIVFFDGLRPDYITAEGMPNLYAFKQQACYGTKHHSVFPTVTRVNSSSYSTGSYPATHGLMGNTVYFPEVDKTQGLNTGDAADLNRIDSATNGHLLTTTSSLGQELQKAGKSMMVFSSGSTGQALLQNHTLSGGITINPSMILPESFRQTVIDDIGAVPTGGKSDANGHAWITDALMKYSLTENGPLVSAIWYSEPDGAAHRYGIGSPEAVAALKLIDRQFGRIIDSMKTRNLYQKFNILISTDHGFATYVGKQKLTDYLIQQGLKKDIRSDDVIVVEGAIYVKDHNEMGIRKIVIALQSQEWVGPVFTKGKKTGELKGFIDGTLSFESVHWNHAGRAADILLASNWDDRKNDKGFAGASYSTGVAGHGGLSPYEVHIALLATGPSFKKTYIDSLPTSNVDIVPTILHIHHIPVPATMDGRVMGELLNEKPLPLTPDKSIIEIIQTSYNYSGGTYKLQLQRTIMGKYKYVDFATIKRIADTAVKAP